MNPLSLYRTADLLAERRNVNLGGLDSGMAQAESLMTSNSVNDQLQGQMQMQQQMQNFATNFIRMMSMFGGFDSSGLGGFGNGLGCHHHHGGLGMGLCNPESSNIAQNLGAGGLGGFGSFGSGDCGDSLGRPQFGGGQDFGGSCPSNQSPWTVTNTGKGQDHIDLGNYTLDLNNSNAGWTLTNKATGATTSISGDPHVSESGNKWDFKNNTTFQLQDGTQITAKTTPAGNGATVTSELDISNGNQGLRVTGLNNGQLQTAPENGRLLAASNQSGNVLVESGNNWLLNGQVVGPNTQGL